METQDEKWGLFWCHLLHPIIFGEIAKEEEHAYMRSLSTQEVLFPDGRLKKPSLSTLKRRLKQYRTDGIHGLRRKSRNDRGKLRATDQEIIDKAIELKKDQPRRSHVVINMFLEQMYGKTVAKTTLYRHLREAGATRRKLGIEKKKVRKRWTRDNTNELWVGDLSNGPYVIDDDGRSHQTYLSLFIDCHSRYVVEGRYYLGAKFDILIDTLLRAWSKHGKSLGLYLDNGKIYHAKALKAACYDLGIKLIYTAPRDPSAKGVVERIFSTIHEQFEVEVRAGDILSLEKLNRAFYAYLDVCYHEKIHSETKQTPKQRYEEGLKLIRHVDMQRAIEFFMTKVNRIVNSDFSDVQIDNRFFRVNPKLRGDKVEVRWDPHGNHDKVLIYSLKQQYLGIGTFHLRDKRVEIQPSPLKKTKHDFLQLLLKRHEERLDKLQSGIDYRKALSARDWPFSAFVATFAYLLGRKGGISAFSCEEYQALNAIYNRHPFVNEALLRQAFEQAEEKTIVTIAYHLDNIKG